ncbi:stage II sporulation protein M [Pontibacillus halophilus JSM 076056 = DSM 19796]|uniref:Stage II sporulation protein M n=1 Tax=Pontibacillus halophilus JSM 076056 = DSM 19796 TaxID=1385510 RepID=A0A0A5GLX6_9BACI|nr:stage II sporulation protein M [Pontibacillus halophilus]KGX92238.1 stage II sporulation protein M [Pontibacillus halophilus JSM 076056 = DSM 19796]
MYTTKGSKVHLHVKEYASIYMFVSLLFLIGIVFGAVIVNSMNFIQKQDLFFYLDRFFGQVLVDPVTSSGSLLKSSLLYHLQYLLVLFVLGMSIIGMPIIWVLIFMKGVVVGFSVGFLVNQMGWYGLLTAAASIAPQNMIIIPVYIIAGSVSMVFSFALIGKLVAKRIQQPLLPVFVRYATLFAILLAVVSVGAVVESYVAPNVLKSVLQLVYNSN